MKYYYLKVRNDISVATFTKIIVSLRGAGFCFDIFTGDIQVLDFRIFASSNDEAEDMAAYIARDTSFPRNCLKVMEDSE